MKKIIREYKFYIIIILILLSFQIKLPYYINTPGGTIDIGNRIEYENMPEYKGSLNMLYVTEYVATIPTYLMSYLIKDWDLESLSSSQLSNETPQEIEVRNKIMLDNSVNNAIYVAYQAAGKKIEVKNKQNLVIGTTLDNNFCIGDEILEIDGKKVEDVTVIKKVLQEREAGESLKVKILRAGKKKELEVTLQEVDGNKVLGVVVVTNFEYEIDPEIELKFKKSESGSSGGLMMALSIYSAISEKDILKGRDIAGTGTIDMEGNIGEIAGIKYKIMGAAKAKMDVVLVPSENYAEAYEAVQDKGYDLEVVEVKTFADAIHHLENTP